MIKSIKLKNCILGKRVKEKIGRALHSAINLCLTNYIEIQFSKFNLSFIGTREVMYPKELFLKQILIISAAKNH